MGITKTTSRSDELNSAIEVGAAGEEKITHRLWPQDDKLPIDPKHATYQFYEDAAVEGNLTPDTAGDNSSSINPVTKRYPSSQVSK